MSQERAVAIYAYQADPTIVHFDEHWHAARKRNEPMSLPVDWDVVAVVQGELAPDGLIINGGGGATFSAMEVLAQDFSRGKRPEVFWFSQKYRRWPPPGY